MGISHRAMCAIGHMRKCLNARSVSQRTNPAGGCCRLAACVAAAADGGAGASAGYPPPQAGFCTYAPAGIVRGLGGAVIAGPGPVRASLSTGRGPDDCSRHRFGRSSDFYRHRRPAGGARSRRFARRAPPRSPRSAHRLRTCRRSPKSSACRPARRPCDPRLTPEPSELIWAARHQATGQQCPVVEAVLSANSRCAILRA